MKKALLPLIIASVLPTAAFADVVVYGKANVSWQYVKADVEGDELSATEVVSNASRIGLKGSEVINDDLKVIYQFEYETKVDDGNNSNSQTFSQRNIYVGLQGSGGTGMIGMFDTPLKVAQEKVDVFNDLVGDLKTVLEGEVRAKNIVQYSTPTFNNITANFAYVNSEKDVPDVSEGYSASLAYSTKELYLALAVDQNSGYASRQVAHDDDAEIIRAVARFTVGPVVLGALYETYEEGDFDEDGFLVSALYNLDDSVALKAQYAQSDMAWDGASTASLGLDYKLSKSTKLFGYYTKIEGDSEVATLTDSLDYVGVGIELNF